MSEFNNKRVNVPKREALVEPLAQLYKVLSDPSRLKIVLLIIDSEMSVTNMADILSMTESAVSHHLRILRMNGLVERRRDGKSILYRLYDDHIHSIIVSGFEHMEETG